MQLATWKRALLAGLLTLSVAGSSLAPVVAGHAAAGGGYRPGGTIRAWATIQLVGSADLFAKQNEWRAEL